MFDIGFWELAIIGVVALLVVGPERLPKLARTAGFWVGRARRYVSSVKQDIEREMRTEELRQILEKQNQERRVYDIIEETRDDLRQTAREVEQAGAELRGRSSSPEGPSGAKPGAQGGSPEGGSGVKSGDGEKA